MRRHLSFGALACASCLWISCPDPTPPPTPVNPVFGSVWEYRVVYTSVDTAGLALCEGPSSGTTVVTGRCRVEPEGENDGPCVIISQESTARWSMSGYWRRVDSSRTRACDGLSASFQ